MKRPEEADVGALGRRVRWLERQNRNLKIGAAIGVLAVAGALWLMRPAASQTVAAQTFVLSDAAGTRRAEVSVVMDEPLVTLYDAEGQMRGAFRIGVDGRPRYQAVPTAH